MINNKKLRLLKNKTSSKLENHHKITDKKAKKTAFNRKPFWVFLIFTLLVLRFQPGFLTFVQGGK